MLDKFKLSKREIDSIAGEPFLSEKSETISSAGACVAGAATKRVSEGVISSTIDKIMGLEMSAADKPSFMDQIETFRRNATIGGVVKNIAKGSAGIVVSRIASVPRIVAASSGALVGNLVNNQMNDYHTLIDMTSAATYTTLAPVITPMGAGLVTGVASGVLKHPVIEKEINDLSHAFAGAIDEIHGCADPYLPPPSDVDESDEEMHDKEDAFMGLGPGI